ncbi:reverse transcriptase domain-containing protein [Tanacetum coccineum]
MQKEKEQQDKLKAVKARLLYGNKSGRNPRNHEESHYSESKTPTARTEPRRRHGRKHSRIPSPVASVFKRLKQNRSPSPRLRPRKEAGVFNRLRRKEPGAYTHSDSHHQSSQARGTEGEDVHRGFHGEIQRRSHGRGRSAGMHEDLRIHAWLPPELIRVYTKGIPKLRKQIDEMIKAGKLSQFIKELKQNDKPKAPKKRDTTRKERPLAILMIQPWEKVAKQKVTQSFSPETTISFLPLGDEDGTEGPMIIKAEIGGHFVHRMYVDGGASAEILYEHCFIRLRPEIRSQMVPPTTYLTGFSGETIWPLGQISLLVKIGDKGHSTSAWMNFMVIRSPSQHNGIIGRPGIIKIRAIPSMAHGMLKFPVEEGTVTLRSSRIILMECAMISGPSTRPPEAGKILEEKIRVAIHPEYP